LYGFSSHHISVLTILSANQKRVQCCCYTWSLTAHLFLMIRILKKRFWVGLFSKYNFLNCLQTRCKTVLARPTRVNTSIRNLMSLSWSSVLSISIRNLNLLKLYYLDFFSILLAIIQIKYCLGSYWGTNCLYVWLFELTFSFSSDVHVPKTTGCNELNMYFWVFLVKSSILFSQRKLYFCVLTQVLHRCDWKLYLNNTVFLIFVISLDPLINIYYYCKQHTAPHCSFELRRFQ
jgi:hypothetical protein